MTGFWVLHIEAPLERDHIHILQVTDDTVGDVEQLVSTPVPAFRWTGEIVDDTVVAGVTPIQRLDGNSFVWSGARLDSLAATMVLTVRGDTARGFLYPTTDDSSSSVFSIFRYAVAAVRFDPAVLQPIAWQVQTSLNDTVPVLLLRMDDIPPTDRAFIRKLTDRGLVAEIAVPTNWVGVAGRPNWDELLGWHALGFGIAAHSRNHTPATHTDVDFIGEVIGSMSDLRVHGLSTTVFVMPGVWTDSLYFTRPMLRTWRGSLLKTVTSDFEAYAYPGTFRLPVGDSVRLGISHVTVSDNFNAAAVLRAWQVAVRPGEFTEMLVHTANLPNPDALDFLLDSVAAAKRAGRVRLFHAMPELFADSPSVRGSRAVQTRLAR